jgi:hypothetical protein
MRKLGILGIAVTLAGLGAVTATTRVAADGHGDDSYRCNNQILTGVTIHANVVVPENAYCDLFGGSRVTGNVDVERTGGLLLKGASSVDRNVVVERDGQVALFEASTVGGSIRCFKCSAADVQNSGAFIESSQIHGSLVIFRSQDGGVGFTLTGNTIGEDVSFVRNTGPSNISGNTIGDELTCSGNTPPPAGGGNTAADKDGQCAGL